MLAPVFYCRKALTGVSKRRSLGREGRTWYRGIRADYSLRYRHVVDQRYVLSGEAPARDRCGHPFAQSGRLRLASLPSSVVRPEVALPMIPADSGIGGTRDAVHCYRGTLVNLSSQS